jgi:hypothetical protein
MNAQQTKALIDAARKARQALLALDTDSIVALELWTAIHRAEAKPASKEKCCFCEEPITGESFPGFTKKLKPRVACRQCTHNYVVARDQFARWCDTPRQAVEVKTRQGRAALRQRLSYCACGGKAEDHREDKDGNLLECSHCDGCDHFHYQTDEAESAKQAA